MAMASAGLRQAMDRRTRATYGLKSSLSVQSENLPRPLSVPAALRLQGSGEHAVRLDTISSPSSSMRSSADPRHEELVSPTAPKDQTSSESPSQTMTARENRGGMSGAARREGARDSNGYHEGEKNDQESPEATLSSGTSRSKAAPSLSSSTYCLHDHTPREVLHKRGGEVAGSRLTGNDTVIDKNTETLRNKKDTGVKSSASTQGVEGGVTNEPLDPGRGGLLHASMLGRGQGGQEDSDLCLPEKLVELMEDRDRAVQLCLQYRWKLKNTEAKLKTTERRASGLKRQLDEASASEENTRKMFAQMMDRAREELVQKIRLADARERKRRLMTRSQY